MKFTDALVAAFDSNARIRRALWSRQVIVGVDSSILCIKGFSSHGPDDGKWHPWHITESDFFADDWEICE